MTAVGGSYPFSIGPQRIIAVKPHQKQSSTAQLVSSTSSGCYGRPLDTDSTAA